MNRPRTAVLRLSLLAALVAPASGCAKREARSRTLVECPGLDAGTPVNPVLLAFLSRARAAHHLADEREQNSDPTGAVAVLDKLVHGPVPGGPDLPPEAREVLSDTHARLADLESRLGHFDAAAEDVGEGLKLATRPSYFRGHLFEVRGLLDERRSRTLRKNGNIEQANKARERALKAFEQAMSIQAEVIKKAVPGKGDR